MSDVSSIVDIDYSPMDLEEMFGSYVGDGDDNPRSLLEVLPNEVFEKVIFYVSDSDLHALTQASKKMAVKLMSEKSGIWKARFLSFYDYPLVESPYEFRVAYQLRRFVLRKFVGCDGRNAQAQICLEVIQDMLLETYNSPKPYATALTHSRNLAAFAATSGSSWMTTFLSSPLYAAGASTFGKPHPLFDALQLTMSHLVLNPRCQIAVSIPTSRLDYDIAKVYLWHMPFETLYHRLHTPESEHRVFPPLPIFPGLTRPPPEHKMQIDFHSLLHIRNFWRRHFTALDESTYGEMAYNLASTDHMPKKWEKALNVTLVLGEKWLGHYTCIHPWPNKREVLEERQSCAEDWNDHTHPMTLDIAVHKNPTNPRIIASCWPPIFSTIPVFAKSTPQFKLKIKPTREPNYLQGGKEGHLDMIYIRGIAPFLPFGRSSYSTKSSESIKFSPIHHPFTHLRIRGLVHTIPQSTLHESVEIPGWHHVMMVLYKPHIRWLYNVYEAALPVDMFGMTIDGQIGVPPGGPQLQAVNPSQNHAHGQSGGQVEIPGVVGGGETTEMALNDTVGAAADGQMDAGVAVAQNGTANMTAVFNPVMSDASLQEWLEEHLSSLPGPVTFTRKLIEDMENDKYEAANLGWEDIEYAYAYEGIILPGGKIMMGRWWMLDCGGMGGGEGEGREAGGGEKGERGAWVFWC